MAVGLVAIALPLKPLTHHPRPEAPRHLDAKLSLVKSSSSSLRTPRTPFNKNAFDHPSPPAGEPSAGRAWCLAQARRVATGVGREAGAAIAPEPRQRGRSRERPRHHPGPRQAEVKKVEAKAGASGGPTRKSDPRAPCRRRPGARLCSRSEGDRRSGVMANLTGTATS